MASVDSPGELVPSLISFRCLEERGLTPIPEGITPHSLRRTFASILVALGRDPAVFQRQMGHATARFTLDVYAAAMAYGDGDRERLRMLVEGRPVSPPNEAGQALPHTRRPQVDGRPQ